MTYVRFTRSLDPRHALVSLQKELERVFERPLWRPDFGPSSRGVFPPVNVFGDQDSTTIRMEVPGVAPENVEIATQGRTLTVKGKREVGGAENVSFHRRERKAGEFSRSIELPADLDLAKAEATVRHGLLTIRIPRREDAKPRTIAVKAA